MHKNRVLLMYITEVSGHHQATLAIEKALKSLDSDVETLNINGFSYAYPILEKVINKAYMGVIKRTPKLWDYLYDNPKIVKRTQALKDAIHKANHAKLAKLFNEFKPDTVVCSQAFPCGMVADYKETYGLNTRLIGVLTDYAPHAYWIHKGVDYYIVPSEESRQRFIKEGVSANQIKLFGIPIDQKFNRGLDKVTLAHQLGLNINEPTILIMGGGQGLGPIKIVVKSLLDLEEKVQLIVVAGVNKKLIRWLKKIHCRSNKKMLIYEYTNNIEELMTVATLIVTKPGGITTTEALTKHLPMVIINPIPGQEVYNTNFLLESGVAIRIDKVKRLGDEISQLLQSSEKIAKMRQAARDNSHPSSAMDIAQLILD